MYIRIRAIASAKKESIIETGDNRYTIQVKEPKLRNLANNRIIEIFREMYPGKRMRIINGYNAPYKLLSIDEE